MFSVVARWGFENDACIYNHLTISRVDALHRRSKPVLEHIKAVHYFSSDQDFLIEGILPRMLRKVELKYRRSVSQAHSFFAVISRWVVSVMPSGSELHHETFFHMRDVVFK